MPPGARHAYDRRHFPSTAPGPRDDHRRQLEDRPDPGQPRRGPGLRPDGACAEPRTGGKTQLLWLGQASFRITSPGGRTIVVDPWITGGTNPLAKGTLAEFQAAMKGSAVRVVPMTEGLTVGF